MSAAMSATFSFLLITGHGSDGMFIGFKASFCETALGHCRPSSSCIAPATCAMTNNSYLYYKCGKPLFPATLTWDYRVRLPTTYLHFCSPAFASMPSRDLCAKIGGVHWSQWAMAKAIHAHSKLESYIREHGDLVTGELYHSWKPRSLCFIDEHCWLTWRPTDPTLENDGP